MRAGWEAIEFPKRKWMLIIASLLVVVLTVLIGGNALYSHSIATPVEDYARSQHLPSDIVTMLKPLDSNHEMNASDKSLVDQLAFVKTYAEKKNLPDDVVEKLIPLGFNHNMTSNEKNFIDYLSEFDHGLQLKVVDSFIGADGNLSTDEAHQIEFLKTLSHSDQVQSIDNGSFANFDWSGDGMSNYFKQNIAHLPFDVYNGRYAIILDTGVGNSTLEGDSLHKFLINEQKFPPQNVIELASTNATVENFKKAVSDISEKAGGNDIVYVCLLGHGNIDIFGFDDGKGDNYSGKNPIMTYEDINKLLDSIKPKEMLVTVSASYGYTAIGPLMDGPTPRVVAILQPYWIYDTSTNYQILGGAPKPATFDIDKNGYVSIDESIETARQYMPPSPVGVPVADKDNIAPNFYLGDFEIQNQA